MLDLRNYMHDAYDLHILSVYSEGTNIRNIPDADNIDVKSVADNIFAMLNFDDNGVQVHLHIGAEITNEVQHGSYIILQPRSQGKGLKNDTKQIIQVLNSLS